LSLLRRWLNRGNIHGGANPGEDFPPESNRGKDVSREAEGEGLKGRRRKMQKTCLMEKKGAIEKSEALPQGPKGIRSSQGRLAR